jgi:hypothetical protein
MRPDAAANASIWNVLPPPFGPREHRAQDVLRRLAADDVVRTVLGDAHADDVAELRLDDEVHLGEDRRARDRLAAPHRGLEEVVDARELQPGGVGDEVRLAGSERDGPLGALDERPHEARALGLPRQRDLDGVRGRQG